MSVRTTADERLDQAAQSIKDAIFQLQDLVINECWGHDEFTEEAKARFTEIYIELSVLKKKLGR